MNDKNPFPAHAVWLWHHHLQTLATRMLQKLKVIIVVISLLIGSTLLSFHIYHTCPHLPLLTLYWIVCPHFQICLLASIDTDIFGRPHFQRWHYQNTFEALWWVILIDTMDCVIDIELFSSCFESALDSQRRLHCFVTFHIVRHNIASSQLTLLHHPYSMPLAFDILGILTSSTSTLRCHHH